MNIFVCVKQVPDTDTKIKPAGNSIDQNGIKWIVNPYDEFAVMESVKIKTTFPNAKIFAVCVGPKARTSSALRTALAMGCDEAVSVDANDDLDSYLTSKALAGAIKKIGSPHVVLFGKSAIDDNNFCVGQMVAEFLEIPHVTSATKSEYTNTSATLEREVEGGSKEILEVEFPALITANKGLNQVKPVSAMNIMKVKSKVIQELSLSDVGVNPAEAKVKYTQIELPAEKPAAKIIDGATPEEKAKKLAQLLREEAKVI